MVIFGTVLFATAFTNTSGCTLELYNTDGSVGAARGAGVGAGVFSSYAESFRGMRKIKEFHPRQDLQNAYGNAYAKWKNHLKKNILNG